MRLGYHLLCLVWFLPACGAVFGQETTVHTDEKLGFSIERPASWEKAKISGGNIVAAFSKGGIRRTLQVMRDQGGEAAGMATLKNLAKILRTQKEISAEWTEVNGRRAYLQKAEWTNILGQNRAIRLMVPAGDCHFLIMAICPAEEYAQLEPLLEKCVLSFKVAK